MNQPFPFTAELSVEQHFNGARIDWFLAAHFRNYTSFRMQRLVRSGQVTVDGAIASNRRRVFARQRVFVRLIEPPDKLYEPEDLPINVIYEDAWILVIDKRAGVISHPVGKHQTGTLTNAVQHHLDRQTPLPGLLRPGIVHRLDRMTSGVMVLSKEHAAHRKLSQQFERGMVAKTYLAVVEGRMPADHGTIDLPLGRVAGGGTILMSAAADARNPKPARTEFTVVERYESHTLVQATPFTGRVHQIRVHLAAVGFPIVGDEFYAADGLIKERVTDTILRRSQIDGIRADSTHAWGSIFPTSRHALHASRLRIEHPISGLPMVFEAAVPADIRAIVAGLSGTGMSGQVVSACTGSTDYAG